MPLETTLCPILLVLAGWLWGGEYPCHRLSSPVTLDGKLDEACWRTLPGQTGFRIAATERYATVRQSTFRMGWDDSALYVGAEFHEPEMGKLTPGEGKPTFFQDSVEIFLLRKEPVYFRLAVSAEGKLEGPTRYVGDMHSGRDVAESGCEARAARGEKTWSVEVRVPFTLLGGRPSANDVWRGNLCRVARVAAGTGEELTTWSYLPRAHFHEYAQYNSIRFVGKSLTEAEAGAVSRQLNADFAAARAKRPAEPPVKPEVLAAAENLCTRKGVHTYPFHFGTEHVLRKESPPGEDEKVWHFPGGQLPIAVIVAWPEPVACNTIAFRWFSKKEPAEHYGVEWWDGMGYRLLFEKEDNAADVSIHTFEPVRTSRLRLTIFRMPVRYYCGLVRLFQVYELPAKEAKP